MEMFFLFLGLRAVYTVDAEPGSVLETIHLVQIETCTLKDELCFC